MPRVWHSHNKSEPKPNDPSVTSAPVPTLRCELCGRHVPKRLITLHHLLPKQKGGTADHRVPLCKPCHKTIHATFANHQLAKEYADLDRLRAAPKLAAFLSWIRKQRPDRNFTVAMSNEHPGSKSQPLRQRRRARR